LFQVHPFAFLAVVAVSMCWGLAIVLFRVGMPGEQEPTRIWLGDERLEVKEIQDRWLSPDHRYFKILCHDNNTYIIRQSSEMQDWELYMYRAGGGA